MLRAAKISSTAAEMRGALFMLCCSAAAAAAAAVCDEFPDYGRIGRVGTSTYR